MGSTKSAKKTKRSFTVNYLESLTPNPDRRYNVGDGDVRHLFLVVHPTGRKVFFHLMKAFDPEKGCDVPRRTQIGVWGDVKMTIDKARERAEQLNYEVSEWKWNGYKGADPLAKVEPSEPVNVPKFSALIEAYIVNHVREEANNPKKAEANLRWMVKKYFSAWLDKRLDKISVEDVLVVKNSCLPHKYMANRCVEVARCLFNWSAQTADGKTRFWNMSNPAKSIETFEEEERTRFLQPEEVVRFDAELKKITSAGDDCPNCRAKRTMRVTAGVVRCSACEWQEKQTDLKDFLTLALATGVRRSNIFSARWDDVKWERLTWHIPHSKNGQAYDVQLQKAALETLKRRRVLIPDGEVFIFPGVGASGHLIDLKKPWGEFRKRAGFPDVHVHDLRRTKASYESISGVSLQQIGAGLGHKSLQSTQVYARLHDEAVRAAGAQGQAKMLELTKKARKRLKAAERKPRLLAAAANG